MSDTFVHAVAQRAVDSSTPLTEVMDRDTALDLALAAFGDTREDYYIQPSRPTASLPLPTGAPDSELGPRELLLLLRPLRIRVSLDGQRFAWSLVLEVDCCAANAAIIALKHEPGPQFWESVAEWLLRNDPDLAHIQEVDFDSEEDEFCACCDDRAALLSLGAKMAALANDGAPLTALVMAARASGVEFDD